MWSVLACIMDMTPVDMCLRVQVFDKVFQAYMECEKCTDVRGASTGVTGSHTVRYLFEFGSSCFQRYLHCFSLTLTTALWYILHLRVVRAVFGVCENS